MAQDSAYDRNSQVPQSENCAPQDIILGARFRIQAYAELSRWSDWVVWGRGKVPLCPLTLVRADARQAKHRLGFESAVQLWRDRPDKIFGVGFYIRPETDLVFVDIDRVAAEDGSIDVRALAIVRSLDSYTERSPSGRGLHIFCHGRLPIQGTGRRDRVRRSDSVTEAFGIELYHHGRYATMTGRHVPGSPTAIEERPEAMGHLWISLFGADPKKWNDLQAVDAELDPSCLHPAMEFPANVLDAMCGNIPGFREVWQLGSHAERFPSLSEHDLSVASYAALCGLPNELIAALIIDNRRRRAGEINSYGQASDANKPFAHKSYLARTIGRAQLRKEKAAAIAGKGRAGEAA